LGTRTQCYDSNRVHSYPLVTNVPYHRTCQHSSVS
uniref:Polyprotein n=1 Tax=Brugia timori TaxID=42155 RepID=A0A0R3QAT4_9BILA